MERVPEEERHPRITPVSLLRDRALFYIGLVLIVFGGLDFALGSYLHDLLNVPVIGEAYEVFGPLNVTFLMIGLVLLLLGFILFGLSLRGGALTPDEVERLRTEGGLP